MPVRRCVHKFRLNAITTILSAGPAAAYDGGIHQPTGGATPEAGGTAKTPLFS